MGLVVKVLNTVVIQNEAVDEEVIMNGLRIRGGTGYGKLCHVNGEMGLKVEHKHE